MFSETRGEEGLCLASYANRAELISSPFLGVAFAPALTLLPNGLLVVFGEPPTKPPKLLLLRALALTFDPTEFRFRTLVGVCGVGGEGDTRDEERKGDVLGPIWVDLAGETNRLTKGEGWALVLGDDLIGLDIVAEADRTGPGFATSEEARVGDTVG